MDIVCAKIRTWAELFSAKRVALRSIHPAFILLPAVREHLPAVKKALKQVLLRCNIDVQQIDALKLSSSPAELVSERAPIFS